MNRLRLEFQDRVNFVLLDVQKDDDADLARRLRLLGHPRFGTVRPNSDDVVERLLGAPRSGELRAMIENILDESGGG